MKRWLHILLNLLSLLLFGIILWWGGPEAWEQLLVSDWRWLLTALLIHGSVGMVSGFRLQSMAQAMGQRSLASWRQFYRLTMTVRALGLVLPRSVSALGGKSVGLMAFGLSVRQSLWTVMVDNAMDVLFLTAVTLPAIPFLQDKISTTTYLLLCGLAVLILAAALWWGSQPGRLNFLLRWLQRFPWLAKKLNLEGETARCPVTTTSYNITRTLHYCLSQHGLSHHRLCHRSGGRGNGRFTPLSGHLPHYTTEPRHCCGARWAWYRRFYLGWLAPTRWRGQ